jgi:hypothetical protein
VVGWRPVQDALSVDDVIAVDLPGFGRSPALPAGVAPTAVALADAIEAELDRLGVAQFHVAGVLPGCPGRPRAGQSLFFAMERSRPWRLPSEDAGRLLLDFAEAPGYLDTVQAGMVDVPTRLERTTARLSGQVTEGAAPGGRHTAFLAPPGGEPG